MYFIIFFPPFAALIGWIVFKIFTILLKQSFYKQRQDVGRQIATAVQELNLLSDIGAMANAGTNKSLQDLAPAIRSKIVAFLTDKLPQRVPAFSMFVGDKIVDIAADSATEEIIGGLPEFVATHAGNTFSDEQIAQLLAKKISNMTPDRWDRLVDEFSKPILNKIQFAGTLLGFILGLAYIFFMFVYAYITSIS